MSLTYPAREVIGSTAKIVGFRVITFLLDCGHKVKRVVLDRKAYRPRLLTCEKCNDARHKALGYSTPPPRPRAVMYPPTAGPCRGRGLKWFARDPRRPS